MLKVRYAPPEFAFLAGVASGTGAQANRFADGVALGLYPSRGMPLHGFEIKVSRSDWLRELREPDKAEAIAQHCNYWWLVTPPNDLTSPIVLPGELPDGWGHIVAKSGKLYSDVLAVRRDQPDRLPRSFVAAVLRYAVRQSASEAEIRAEVEKALGDQAKRFREQREGDRANDRLELDRLKSGIAKFEEASGIRFSDLGAERLGADIAAILNGTRTIASLRYTRDAIARALVDLDKAIEPAEVVLDGQ